MMNLNFPKQVNDQDTTFRFAFNNHRGVEQSRTGYLFDDTQENVIYILQTGVMIQDVYSEKDVEERNRLNAQVPVRHDDVVEVEGKQYTVKILGNYSDAGRLVPITQ